MRNEAMALMFPALVFTLIWSACASVIEAVEDGCRKLWIIRFLYKHPTSSAIASLLFIIGTAILSEQYFRTNATITCTLVGLSGIELLATGLLLYALMIRKSSYDE